MSEIKILKEEYIDSVLHNPKLREEIAEVEFIKPDSVRMLARNAKKGQGEKLSKYNILCVIKRFLKLKTVDEMFITKKIVK